MAGGRGQLIADAIVAELNDPVQTWNATRAMNSYRAYVWVHKPEDVKILRVVVSTLELERKRESRPLINTHEEKYTVSIDFQQAMDPAYFDATGNLDGRLADQLDAMADAVLDFYSDAHAVTIAGKSWLILKADRPVIYNANLLYRENIWETQILLTVRANFP